MAEASIPPIVADALLAQRQAFKAFVTARIGNEADAEDLLQQGLVKALQHAGGLKDEERAVAWFYQLLRNVIVDHVRSRDAARRRDDAWASDAAATATLDRAAENVICGCFNALLPTLKPSHGDLLRRVELDGDSVSAAAAALGITPNNASVTLHRARAELRRKLEEFCGACSDGACLDCSCEPPKEA